MLPLDFANSTQCTVLMEKPFWSGRESSTHPKEIDMKDQEAPLRIVVTKIPVLKVSRLEN